MEQHTQESEQGATEKALRYLTNDTIKYEEAIGNATLLGGMGMAIILGGAGAVLVAYQHTVLSIVAFSLATIAFIVGMSGIPQAVAPAGSIVTRIAKGLKGRG